MTVTVGEGDASSEGVGEGAPVLDDSPLGEGVGDGPRVGVAVITTKIGEGVGPKLGAALPRFMSTSPHMPHVRAATTSMTMANPHHGTLSVEVRGAERSLPLEEGRWWDCVLPTCCSGVKEEGIRACGMRSDGGSRLVTSGRRWVGRSSGRRLSLMSDTHHVRYTARMTSREKSSKASVWPRCCSTIL